ncbi:transcriptional regulator family: Fungal Specific TF [Penicillium macrosclerotiorum]|uniref:transcriptional regulator family: Fungal Specific TF n=1 Tax=Penicillium macrosclerotiorum TaxID=303699 RepID=UPI00254753B6|nr:transcriptional regulator family: Fungal Specific TF [Penicillium macrosclerotiorum]KAJ5682811.1 transcriptional regulator family: Fungal Specific TF [Penicillium macrosclerotiorum]
MPPPAKRSGRIGSTKSKTGCDTCKVRRVRCGEEKPCCTRCTSTGRRCSYSTASAPKGTGTFNGLNFSSGNPSVSLAGTFSSVLESQAGLRERRAFEYYFHQAGPSLSGDLDVSFWRICVLQICRMEPAVWDAIISLGALYERPPVQETPPFRLINDPATIQHAYHHEALIWYSRSLATLQARIDQGTADIGVSLISCLLFIAIELLQGNRNAALTLYKQGLRLMASTDRTPLGSIIRPIFRRMGTWASIRHGFCENSDSLNLAIPIQRFASIDEARNVLCEIVAEMIGLNTATKEHWHQVTGSHEYDSPVLMARKEQLERRLHDWYRLFMSLEPTHTLGSGEMTKKIDGAKALLLMTYLSVLIEVQTTLDLDQTAYDSYELEFSQILVHASTALAATRRPDDKQPPFMFEMGVFLPLFITALKCRYPRIRRQALRLLWEAPPVQGLFMCEPAAYVVAVLVALEENQTMIRPPAESEINALLLQPGSFPGQRDRVWDFNVSSEMNEDGQMQTWLHYSLRDFACEDGRIQFIERKILLPDNEPSH